MARRRGVTILTLNSQLSTLNYNLIGVCAINDIRIFVDFGSTFTKVVAFDLDKEELSARVQAPSTVDTDITVGLAGAFAELRKAASVSDERMRDAVACSSAAGGLRMVCVGLVPDYTTKAGHLAALGAGAKVVGTFSFELSGSELGEIAALKPDIVLLTGGTDGGNKAIITHNARRLSEISESLAAVIVAGNKSANDDIAEAFKKTGLDVSFTSNVMPEFGMLELGPVNERIRELFIGRITRAKGIARVDDMIGGVVMPTPSAVLEAAKLISAGTKNEAGFGELMMVDVGGATTDIYSIAAGTPTRDGVHIIGLREPHAKRTVEGDLGLYHNLDSLAEIYSLLEPDDSESARRQVEDLRKLLSIPSGDEQTRYQLTLSRLAVKTAVERHVGRLERIPRHDGDIWVQRGKDLSKIDTVIGAGGPLAFSSDPRHVLEGAAADKGEPLILKPQPGRYLLDARYIMFAIGLLSRDEPDKAVRIIKKYLREI